MLRHGYQRFVLPLQGATVRPPPGFAIRHREVDRYHVCSTGSAVPAFIGTLRECYVFILGYCWNRGVE